MTAHGPYLIIPLRLSRLSYALDLDLTDHNRAALRRWLAAARSGGDAADDTGSAGEGEIAHRVRRALLMLKVCLVGEGALEVDGDCSP